MDLIRRIRAGNFELVHIHYAYLGNIGSLGGFPYILHCHGTDLRGATPVTRPIIRKALRDEEHEEGDRQAVVEPGLDVQGLPNPQRHPFAVHDHLAAPGIGGGQDRRADARP